MFHLHNSLKYFLYPLPVDMRKSFYTLSGVVTSAMNRNVRDGDVFIFVNRDQTIMKILHMEYAGLVIYHKKLESGRFKLPAFDQNTTSLTINWQEWKNEGKKCKNKTGKTSKKTALKCNKLDNYLYFFLVLPLCFIIFTPNKQGHFQWIK
jgi:transposase